MTDDQRNLSALPLPARLTVTVNGEEFIALGLVVEALARIYVAGMGEASAVALVCDDHLDRRGALLGYVRDRASEIRRG